MKTILFSAFVFLSIHGIYAQRASSLELKPLSFQKSMDRSVVSNLSQQYSPLPKNILFDSIYIWRIDSARYTGKLVDIEYNTAKLLTSGVFKNLKNNKWENAIKYEYGYDGNGNETHSLEKKWEGNAWVNTEQTTRTYIGNKLETMLQQEWEPVAGAWENIGKMVYSYDSNGNQTIEESNPWNGNSFEPNFRFVTTYDSHNLAQDKTGQSYMNGVWTDVVKEFFLYDSQGNMLQLLLQDKDASSNWRNSDKLESTYDAGNRLLTESVYHWNILNSVWEELYKNSAYTWDPNNNLIAYKTETLLNGAYVLSADYMAAYNSSSQLTDEATSEWQSNGTLNSKDSTHYFIHSSSNGITDQKPGKNTLLIYPNPTYGTFNVLMENKHPVKTVEVYNIIGERVLQQHASSLVTLANVPAGIYFVRVDDGTAIYTTKVTVR